MVLKAKIPVRAQSLIRLIEKTAAREFSLRDLPLRKYISLSKVAAYMGKDESKIKALLFDSATLHAIHYENRFLVHPDSVINTMKKIMRKAISKEIASYPKAHQ